MFMRSLAVALLLSVIAETSFARDPEESIAPLPAGVTVASLAIKRPINKQQVENLWINGFDGTNLTLLFIQPDKTLFMLDEKASKLASFADDKGTNLLKTDEGFGQPFSFPHFSADGHSASIEIRSAKVPAADATRLRIKGTLVFRCGSDSQTQVSTNTSLAEGTKLTLGPIAATVGSRGRNKNKAFTNQGNDKNKLEVSFDSKESFDAIKSLRFLNADGTEIKSRHTGSGSIGFGDAIMQYSLHCELEQTVTQANIEVTYWGKMETLKVPLDVQVGPGL